MSDQPVKVEKKADDRGMRRVAIGVVTSDKMNKTRRVQIERLVRHAKRPRAIARPELFHARVQRVEDQRPAPAFAAQHEVPVEYRSW